MTTTDRSVAYDTFTIVRDIPASPARVFRGFSDFEQKQAWFGDPEGSTHTADFRVGGKEVSEGAEPHGSGFSYRFDATYHDIVDDERIIYSYEMYVDGRKLSVSLTTITFEPSATGTLLTFTEHGAYLDGHEDPALRERGTQELLDKFTVVVTS